MKSLVKLFVLGLILSSCSETEIDALLEDFNSPTVTFGNCENPNYLAIVYNECSCTETDNLCKTFSSITYDQFYCIIASLNESDNGCIHTENVICSDITFSGYIKEVIVDCP